MGIIGLSGCLASLLGSCVGTMLYMQNVSLVHHTKSPCRIIMIVVGWVFVFLGVFTKFAVVIATIPEPMLGGILGFIMTMILGMAFTCLQSVNLTIPRNISIITISIMLGVNCGQKDSSCT
uniref:Uncharacterized protein n=1 Tax=Acrobeloides nanus TaxID=290746 RepID=A0A914CT39_9BILA